MTAPNSIALPALPILPQPDVYDPGRFGVAWGDVKLVEYAQAYARTHEANVRAALAESAGANFFPAGFVLVPCVPTAAMLMAWNEGDRYGFKTFGDRYQAMLNAAPKVAALSAAQPAPPPKSAKWPFNAQYGEDWKDQPAPSLVEPDLHALCDAMNAAERAYVDAYELDDGEGAPHTPNEFESLLIADAVAGLLANEEWAEAYYAWDVARRAAGYKPWAAPVVGEASPDVAKMVEEARGLANHYGSTMSAGGFCPSQTERQDQRRAFGDLIAAIDALGAAATQAKACTVPPFPSGGPATGGYPQCDGEDSYE